MTETFAMFARDSAFGPTHDHVFLGERHEANERRAWAVIWLCAATMAAEIIGGLMFGSIALVADGLHMSTHAGALLLAALAYSYARKHAKDPRFSFGTGKFGDLAGFSSAIVLAMIALLIGYEAVTRLFHPQPIRFGEAIPIAALGLAVNVASVWLLSGGHHHYGHGNDDQDNHDHDEIHRVKTEVGAVLLSIFEDGEPPRFRLAPNGGGDLDPAGFRIDTLRPDGVRQAFALRRRDGMLESIEEIPEPHAFTATVSAGSAAAPAVAFEEHEHPHGAHHHHHDNNMRAAIVHVMADAAVSVLVISGLLLGRFFGWVWMDAVAGMIGAVVIASWSYGLIRDTGAILLDMTPDQRLAAAIRQAVETEGDQLADLHLWRLGPGHLGAILSVVTRAATHGPNHFKGRLARFRQLSHVTVEVLEPTEL
jgi:cation diffusion facilitator family transporter